MLRKFLWCSLLLLLFWGAGCVSPNVKFFTDATDPLKEYVLEGEGQGKVLLIPVTGIITDVTKEHFLKVEPSMVQDIVSQLRLARKDSEVKAVVLEIDSPGGSVTASDVLYHELMRFKKETGIKIVAVMMNVAASGGYYVALSSDYIIAHPTSVTGSVGVIFLRPKVYGLLDKIGVGVVVNTSGDKKDMGSPFRKETGEEDRIFQNLTADLGKRFLNLVLKNRSIPQAEVDDISSARIYLAREALAAGLVDEIGYVDDAIDHARKIAGLGKDSKVVVYRRTEYPDDNIYNTQTRYGAESYSLIDIGLPASALLKQAGFYYLWPAGIGEQ